MLPVAGVPFVTHQLARLRAVGVDHVVLATSYQPTVFADHFGDGGSLGLALDYVTEAEPLGTGGGLRNVAPLLRSGPDDPVLVLNGDVLSGHDLSAQLAEHIGVAADVTLHLTEVADARAFGSVPTDETGRVIGFVEKSPEPTTNQINAGCYVFRRSVIEHIPVGHSVSVERETFPELLEAGARLQGYVDTTYWLDIGTPEAYVRGSCDLVLGRINSPALPGPSGDSLVLEGASVAADAALRGGTTIGAGVRVGAGTVLDGCVVADGASVGAGCTVVGSAIGRGTVIGDGAVLDGAVLGDRVTVGRATELRGGIRIWPDTIIPDGGIRFSSDV